MSKEYKTTPGELKFTTNENGSRVDDFDHPIPPDGDGWEMCGSCLGQKARSVQTILWFWVREKV